MSGAKNYHSGFLTYNVHTVHVRETTTHNVYVNVIPQIRIRPCRRTVVDVRRCVEMRGLFALQQQQCPQQASSV